MAIILLVKIGQNRKVGCEFIWDTNSWSKFCDPHWEHICHNKWHPWASKISTPPEIAAGSHFHVQHGTKTTLVFLSADREVSWLLLSSSVSLLSDSTVQPENTYSCIIKVGAKKEWVSTIITATISFHLPNQSQLF